MADSDRLEAIFARRREATEEASREVAERERRQREQAEERTRLRGLWKQRVAELREAVNRLNEPLAAEGMSLVMEEVDPDRVQPGRIANATVKHRQNTRHVRDRWLLAVSVQESGKAFAVISSGPMGLKDDAAPVEFDVGAASGELWDRLLVDFLEATVVGPSKPSA